MKNHNTTYVATIVLTVHRKHNAITADNADSMAAAVRQYMRVNLHSTTTKGGLLFQTSDIHVEAVAKQKETVSG